MLQTLRIGAAVVAGGLLLAGLPTTTMAQPSEPASKCAASKEKAIAKHVLKRLKCYSKAAKDGLDRDPALNADLALCIADQDTKAGEDFAKAEAEGGCATDANIFNLNPPEATGDGLLTSILSQVDKGWAANATTIGYRGIDGPRLPEWVPDAMAPAPPEPDNGGVVQLVAPGTTVSNCAKKQLITLAVFGKKLHLCEQKAIKKGIAHEDNGECVTKAVEGYVKKFDKTATEVDCLNTADRDTLAGYMLNLSNVIIPNIPRYNGCGNGLVTNGMSGTLAESCDDGNLVHFDNCPDDCVFDTCTETANPRPATLVIAGPDHLNVASVIIDLDYPEGIIHLPGTGFAPAAIQDLTFADSFDSVDFDHALRVVASSASAFGQAQIANMDFDDCSVGGPPTPANFTCVVRQAFGVGGTPDLTATTTCTVTIP